MWTVMDTLVSAVTLSYLLAAATIYFAAPRRTANRLLSVAVSLEPIMGGAYELLRHLGGGPSDAYAMRSLFVFTAPLWTALYLGFLGTLPSPLSRPIRTKVGTFVLIAYPVAMWTLFLATPDSFLRLIEGEVQFGRFYETIRIPIFLLMIYALFVAVTAWHKAEPRSTTRTRLGIYALAFGARDLLVIVFLTVSFGVLPIDGGTAARLSSVLVLLPAVAFLPLFTYGVLKYHLLDIDLKIKWTINRSTIAAAFVAAFFAASEGASAFFESSTGSTAAGIAAAALLVFALSPLQRVAEKVADKAMPHVQDNPEYRDRRREEVYQGAIEELLADGLISVKERKTLIRLQRELGLDAANATRIEEQTMGALDPPQGTP